MPVDVVIVLTGNINRDPTFINRTLDALSKEIDLSIYNFIITNPPLGEVKSEIDKFIKQGILYYLGFFSSLAILEVEELFPVGSDRVLISTFSIIDALSRPDNIFRIRVPFPVDANAIFSYLNKNRKINLQHMITIVDDNVLSLDTNRVFTETAKSFGVDVLPSVNNAKQLMKSLELVQQDNDTVIIPILFGQPLNEFLRDAAELNLATNKFFTRDNFIWQGLASVLQASEVIFNEPNLTKFLNDVRMRTETASIDNSFTSDFLSGGDLSNNEPIYLYDVILLFDTFFRKTQDVIEASFITRGLTGQLDLDQNGDRSFQNITILEIDGDQWTQNSKGFVQFSNSNTTAEPPLFSLMHRTINNSKSIGQTVITSQELIEFEARLVELSEDGTVALLERVGSDPNVPFKEQIFVKQTLGPNDLSKSGIGGTLMINAVATGINDGSVPIFEAHSTSCFPDCPVGNSNSF